MTLLIVAILVQAVVIGSFCGFVAEEKGRSGQSWFWLGACFSLIALIALVGIPERRKE